MKKTFALLSILLFVLATTFAEELLQNTEMNPCPVEPIPDWEGGDGNVVGSNVAFFIKNIADGTDCLALLAPNQGTESLTQTIEVTTAGLYDFSSSLACVGKGNADTCEFFLTINNQAVTVSPLTKDSSGNLDNLLISVTASGIFLPVGTYDIVFGGTVANTNSFLYVSSMSLATAASGSGDPHMVGFHGQVFDYIGVAGQVINMLSDPELQLNTLLGLQKIGENSFFSGPVMMEMAFMTRGHTVTINAGGYKKEETGFVTVDGVLLPLGQSFLDGILSVSFSALSASSKDHGLSGNDHLVGQVDVKIEDLFEFRVFLIENGKDNLHHAKWVTNYPRRFLDFNASLLDQDRRPHGILGQTAAPLSKDRSVGEWTIEGKDEDYVVKDGLNGSQFTFNQF